MYIWLSNSKRCNPNARYTDEQGTRYAEVPAHLYQQIADPVRGDESFYTNQEIEDAPYLVVTPKSVESIREMLKARVKALRDQKETEGFAYMGKVFDSDERSVARITSAALTALAIGNTFTIDWTAADNSVVTLDQAAMLGMPAALAVYANDLHTTAKAHKAAIDAADFDTLKTYDITTGWPA